MNNIKETTRLHRLLKIFYYFLNHETRQIHETPPHLLSCVKKHTKKLISPQRRRVREAQHNPLMVGI